MSGTTQRDFYAGQITNMFYVLATNMSFGIEKIVEDIIIFLSTKEWHDWVTNCPPNFTLLQLLQHNFCL